MQGYIKLYRKTMNSPIWQDPYYLKLWLYCLMKATHKEHEQLVGNNMVVLKPGEFVTGRKALALDLNSGAKPEQRLSDKTWYRYLENLQSFEMLSIRKTNKFSIITILKWAEYQEGEQQVKPPGEGKKKGTKKKYDENSKPYKLAKYLVEEIRKNLPEFKEPDLQKWADDMRKIIELDKRDPRQAAQLIKWTQQNNFWWKNVMSPSKFRDQYDKLLANAKNEKLKQSPQQPVKQNDSRDKEIEFQRWVQEGNDPDAFNWGA
ncbi:hypothetical protein M3175_01390 [Robertmurraya korlensis]|nr:hypothetical protein [Robertmurraya korlensis]